MPEPGRLVRLVPPGVALGGLIVAAAASFAAAAPPAAVLAACTGGTLPLPAMSATTTSAAALGGHGVGTGPWFRLDPVLDERGALEGQELRTGLGSGSWTLRLPAEAAASGSSGGLVLVVADDGAASTITILDLARTCRHVLAREPEVVRRAVLDPTGRWVYEARVERSSRADLGVWRRPLDGSTTPERVVEPLPPDERFGPTFTTQLEWAVDAPVLVVHSCGGYECRSRIHDPANGRTTLLDHRGVGDLIGVAGGTVLAHGACRGLPCPIVAVDQGEARVLATDVGQAVLAATKFGPRLVHEVARPGGGLAVVDPVDGRIERIVEIPAGSRLVAAPGRSRATFAVPSGSVVVRTADDTSVEVEVTR